jgi:hypothetical protein
MEDNNAENKIQEVQILEPEKTEEINSAEVAAKESVEVRVKKSRRYFYIELALFFILGMLIGIALKTEALKKITIGYDDYRMKIEKQDYDINKLQADLNAAQAEAQENAQEELEADQSNEPEQPNL